ncbi:MAG TPA: hypothetical protein VIF62_01205 [Labilithrix sp.]
MIATSAIALATPQACKDPYVAPCSVGQEVVVLDARKLTAASSSSLVEEAGGAMVYVSLVPRPLIADAGADASDDPDAQMLPMASEVVVLRADGSTAETHTFAAPAALDARRGNTGDAAVSFTGDGAIFHWVEDAIAQDADGRTTTTTTLKTAFVGNDGTQRDVVVPASGTCEECRVSFSFATLGGTTVAILHTTPDGARAVPKTSRTTAVTFGRDGAILSETTPTFLLASDEDGGAAAPAVTIETHDDAFVVGVGTRLLLTDASLVPFAGPFATPGATTLAWDAASREAVLAWVTTGSTAAPTTSSASAPSLPGIYVQRVAASGAAITGAARVTTAANVLAVARSADRIGVLVGTGAESIAVADEDGSKLSGDQPIASGTRSDASVGGFGSRSRLFPAGDRRFVRWSSQPTRVTRTELVCASP